MSRRPAGRGPRLGVGICALNEEEGLGRLLPRLLGEGVDGGDPARLPDLADRVVVADGGSTDGTLEVVRASGATLVEGARGRGAQLAAAGARLLEDGAEVLLFLHADCLPGPGALDAVRRAFERSDLVAAGMAQRVAAEGRAYRWIEAAADARVRRGMVFGDSGLAVRAAAYRSVGGFEPQPLFEDVRISRRLRRLGAVRLVEGAPLAVSARRWEDEGVLRCTVRNWILRTLHALGVPPRTLVRLYRPFRGRPRP
ncbi:MAG: glycosyltransferase [Planctomycetota bacterium]